jgi:RecA-family ATPase
VLAGAPKVGKSWAALDLGMSVATGTPWLKWPTVKGRVAYVDYELMEPIFRNRMQLVQAAKLEKFENLDFSNFEVSNMCGKHLPFETVLQTLISRSQVQRYSLIIIDPLYQATGGRGENSPNAINDLCSRMCELSKQTSAAVLLVHHFSKGRKRDVPLVDRFAGSGMLTRDAFTLIGLTKHNEPDYVKLEFELRNFPEQPAVALQRKSVVFEVSDEIDLGAFERQANEKKEDRSKALLDLLGTDGLTASDWEKQAEVQHKIPRATFFRDKKKLLEANKVHQDGKTKRWKIAEPSGAVPS